MTALLPFLLIFGVLLLVGIALVIALATVRRTRRELERRTGMISGRGGSSSRHGGTEPEALHEPDWRDRLGYRLRRIYAVGLSRTWGMRTAALALLVTAAIAACAGWLGLR